MLLICKTLLQLSVWTLLQVFTADHWARQPEGQQAVCVTWMSEPEEEDDGEDAAAGKSRSRCRSWFLSGRTSHRPIRYDGRLAWHNSSLAGKNAVRMPTTVCHWLWLSHLSLMPHVDLEHGTHEAGRGITSPSRPLLTLSQRACVFKFLNVDVQRHFFWATRLSTFGRMMMFCFQDLLWRLEGEKNILEHLPGSHSLKTLIFKVGNTFMSKIVGCLLI